MNDHREKLAGVDWRVYVIVDPRFVPENRTPVEVARAAIRGGAGVIQLRDKISTAREMVGLASKLQNVCRDEGALFIVNDRLDVALAVGADGVHLGPDDIPVDLARKAAPPLIIGASAGTVERARELEKAGADYLGCGAVYEARESKPDASLPRGPELIRSITDAVNIPVVGIGGIDASNAADVRAAGAAGVAVIRAVVSAEDPRAATRQLRSALQIS